MARSLPTPGRSDTHPLCMAVSVACACGAEVHHRWLARRVAGEATSFLNGVLVPAPAVPRVAMQQQTLQRFFCVKAGDHSRPLCPQDPASDARAMDSGEAVGVVSSDADGYGGLCEYEKEREARIQVNRHRLDALGLRGGIQANLPAAPSRRPLRCTPNPPGTTPACSVLTHSCCCRSLSLSG